MDLRIRASMVGPLTLDAVRRRQVEAALRPHLTEATPLEDVIEQVQNVLGELRADIETGIYDPERRAETIGELDALHAAAEDAHKAAALGEDARTALLCAFRAPPHGDGTPTAWTLDGQAALKRVEDLRRLVRVVARDAGFAADRLRAEPKPKGGRPRAEAARQAMRPLVELWEKCTGQRAKYLGKRDDGGPCLGFVTTCIRAALEPGTGDFDGTGAFREIVKERRKASKKPLKTF